MSMTLKDFLSSNIRNAHIVEKPFKIYVRKSRRFINRELLNMIDIATIAATTPGTGKLGALFDIFEQLPFDGVFVECVQGSRLREWLSRRGYLKLPNPADPEDLSPCYFFRGK